MAACTILNASFLLIITIYLRDITCRNIGPISLQDIEELNDVKPLDMPVECINTQYCSVKPKNYPDAIISKVLKKIKYHQFLRTPAMLAKEEMNNRFAEFNELWGKNDCDKKEINVTIYSVKRDSSLIIINSKEFPQQLTGEICLQSSSKLESSTMECFRDLAPQPTRGTFCKQIDTQVEVLAINIVTKSLEFVQICDFPIACSCYHKTLYSSTYDSDLFLD